jgi:hypothetical protein
MFAAVNAFLTRKAPSTPTVEYLVVAGGAGGGGGYYGGGGDDAGQP